jgi:hypothetical protein
MVTVSMAGVAVAPRMRKREAKRVAFMIATESVEDL